MIIMFYDGLLFPSPAKLFPIPPLWLLEWSIWNVKLHYRMHPFLAFGMTNPKGKKKKTCKQWRKQLGGARSNNLYNDRLYKGLVIVTTNFVNGITYSYEIPPLPPHQIVLIPLLPLVAKLLIFTISNSTQSQPPPFDALTHDIYCASSSVIASHRQPWPTKFFSDRTSTFLCCVEICVMPHFAI